MNQNNWFTNNGQLLQLVVAVVACAFAGIRAWPEMKVNKFFSFGAIVFYTLVVFVVLNRFFAFGAIVFYTLVVVFVLLAVKFKNYPSIKLIALSVMVAGGTWELKDTLALLKQQKSQIESLRNQIDELKEPVINILEEPIHKQMQDVHVIIEPPPPPGQTVQVWVRAGDKNWYPCLQATPSPAPPIWTAKCQFGIGKGRDAAVPGKSPFDIGAFYSKDYIDGTPAGLPDTAWYSFKVKRAVKHIVFTGK